jgi:hypothetical protein
MNRKIRQSQTITPFGVGAIFDVQGESFVACDIWEWGGRGEPVVSERLTNLLGIRGLKAAPAADDNPYATRARGIPYARFPRALFCQHCRGMVFRTRSAELDGKPPSCPTCDKRRQLVPMRWIQICERGHMSDVDWRWWAHWGASDPEQRQCQIDDRIAFETIDKGGSGGLDTLVVRCRACNAQRSLSGITGKETLHRMGVRCSGRQPWQTQPSAEPCPEIPRAVQRGASNVYFPLTHSSIEIPTASAAETQSEKALDIKQSMWFPPLLDTAEDDHMFAVIVQKIADEKAADDALVLAVLRDERRQRDGRATAVIAETDDLLAGEWAAFITPFADLDPDGYFVTRHVDLLLSDHRQRPDLAALEDVVSRCVIADRLREVRALEGFHRVTPAGRDKMVPAALDHRLDWLPAIEAYGEGIFLSLDEARLAAWEQRDDVQARVTEMQNRLDVHFMADRLKNNTGPLLAPRYVLLHTLGHLLIRQLAFESGYSAASLRERVYAKSAVPGKAHEPQAGVLVYTAAGDAEGTLGGLARQGETGRFSDSLITLLHDATWCSADPLCRENRAQGFGSLNYAACHACCLVAETSCESGNLLLDRALVVGGSGVRGFFQHSIEATMTLAAETVALDR